jgi:hypothetical protein
VRSISRPSTRCFKNGLSQNLARSDARSCPAAQAERTRRGGAGKRTTSDAELAMPSNVFNAVVVSPARARAKPPSPKPKKADSPPKVPPQACGAKSPQMTLFWLGRITIEPLHKRTGLA